MGASAVPSPMYASAPALQWVRILKPSLMSLAPDFAISSVALISSLRMYSAVLTTFSTLADTFPQSAASRHLSTALNRLAAVGRVLRIVSAASLRYAMNSFSVNSAASRAACAMPNPAAHPMLPAPRVTMTLMAQAVSLWSFKSMISKLWGSFLWSTILTTPPSRQTAR